MKHDEHDRQRDRREASQAVFGADLARMNATLTELGAVVVEDDGSAWVDPTMVPEGLLGTYSRLLRYGYATGLL